jgi:hypothetical protein
LLLLLLLLLLLGQHGMKCCSEPVAVCLIEEGEAVVRHGRC